MIGGRLNGKHVGRTHLLHRAEHPADHRLRAVGGGRAGRRTASAGPPRRRHSARCRRRAARSRRSTARLPPAASAAAWFSTCCTTARVRDTEAPSGNWTAMKNAPWSSSGRKPVGVMLRQHQMPAPATAITTSDRTATPQQPAHHRGIAVAHAGRCRRASSRSGPRGWPWWRRNTPHNAGDSVSALIAEISIATLMVTANWRNSVPDTPGMKPTGTNTDSSTKRDRDHRPGDLPHRLLGRILRRQVRLLRHHPLDVLHHHDRVIHHDADAKHHRQQRNRVGGESDRQQHGERADQADRNGDHRDDRRAQIAEEQEHDQRPPARRRCPASSPPPTIVSATND